MVKRVSYYSSVPDPRVFRFFKVRDQGVVAACFLADTEEHDCWLLSSVWVTPRRRGEGFGSHLLETVFSWADQHGQTLVLECSPYGDAPNRLDESELLAWYKRNGFHWDRSWQLYLRKPKND